MGRRRDEDLLQMQKGFEFALLFQRHIHHRRTAKAMQKVL
jgi:hypothetical protein